MNHTALFLAALATASVLGTAACSSGDVPVGSTGSQDQKLQKGKNGGSTGNGKTCSWDDAVSSDGTTTPSPNGQYKVGDQFKSPDGCNSCACTEQGIACTEVACNNNACDLALRVCNDGSAAKQAANCVQVCPEDSNPEPAPPMGCPAVQRICNDGSNAQSYPGQCKQWCPEDGGSFACQDDARVCPDGSAVGRRGPACEFTPCPGAK